jgi:GNAT superfamily N-acetyltransferase
MEHADVGFAKYLTDVEQWGHTQEDFKRLMCLDPGGCFVAWDKGCRVGIATTVTYDRHAFLGNIIVDKKRRGANIGPALMQHAIDYLENKGVRTIELDGVSSAVAMYRHMGFKDKYWSLRFARSAQRGDDTGVAFAHCAESVESIVGFDYLSTGIERKALIRALLQEFPAGTFCLNVPRVMAYTVLRERANGTLAIGPLIAEDPRAGATLMARVVAKFGHRHLAIGVPEINKAAVDIMLQNNFQYCTPSLRMYRGQRYTYEGHIYAIVSADVG